MIFKSLLLLLICQAFVSQNTQAISLWPVPQSIQQENSYFTINPATFSIIAAGKAENCQIIDDAITRYTKLFFLDDCSQLGGPKCQDQIPNEIGPKFKKDANYLGVLNNLTIMTSSCETRPISTSSEVYTLRVMSADFPDRAMIYSPFWGALHGLETFSQLIYKLDGHWVINATFIVDYPRFQFRGLLLDTSRHFIPVHTLLDNLDAMAYNKLNVFHWHIVDDQSFPFVSDTYPELSAKGAFTSKHTYSRDDVNKVLDYAAQRGIRVIVEFDTPGHTLSWGKALPNLLTQCYKGDKIVPGSYGPINPASNETYSILAKFFSEITRVFSDEYLHLGGDEVDFSCWQSNPEINKFMSSLGIKGRYADLESYYLQKLVEIIGGLKKSYIVWQEVFDNGVHLARDAVVHVWKSGDYQNEMDKVTKSGYRTILSSPWYLNYISYGPDWQTYYKVEPLNFNGTESQHELVMGGEACMWGEYVDGSNVISRTWPRASAVAERLWSASDVTSITSAISRLDEQRCRMMKRGLRVEPAQGPGYCNCDLYL